MLGKILHTPSLTISQKRYVFVTESRYKKCPYSKFFWSVFSRIWTEYGDLQVKSPYSVWMRENADQKNSKCELFSRPYLRPY